MLIKYTFNNGETSEVEVSDEIGEVILNDRRREESEERTIRRHAYSLDAIAYEGSEYGEADFAIDILDGQRERNAEIWEAFSHLTNIQQERLLLLASGMSIREIAKHEDRDFSTVRESIESAKKKFLKFLKNA